MMKKICIIVMMALCVSGCGYKPKVGAPWMQKLMKQGPEGPTMFKVGWRDGCETGLSSVANTFQRHFYTFKQDYKLARDPVYYTGWKSAYIYCQRYVFQYLRRAYL